jgi:mono/diheme cytochrome c family protein
MKRTRTGPRIAGVRAAFGLALAAAALAPGPARAQLAEPPLGWDMWDPGWTRRDAWQPERMDESLRWRTTRHQAFLRDGVPAAYRGVSNPLRSTPEIIREGGALYLERCAGCHDPAGMGHGDAGLALYPSPALLADLIRMPQAVDEYLLWAIAEGGAPFGTRMPAFKDALSQEQIWQIIAYMRAGFPAPGASGQERPAQ